jgi:hypothetical protein
MSKGWSFGCVGALWVGCMSGLCVCHEAAQGDASAPLL